MYERSFSHATSGVPVTATGSQPVADGPALDLALAVIDRMREEIVQLGGGNRGVVGSTSRGSHDGPTSAEEALIACIRGSQDRAAALQLGMRAAGGILIVARCQDETTLARLQASVRTDLVTARLDATTLVSLEICPSATDAVATKLRAIERCLGFAHRQLPHGWTAGVSAVVTDPADLPQAFKDTTEIALLAARDGVGFLRADQNWARVASERLRRAGAEFIPHGSPLTVLPSYDEKHGTEFAKTVICWLDHNCDTRTTADALHIHTNTLRYRLRRAAALAELDLDDPQQRLVCQIALPALAAAQGVLA